MRTRPLLEPRLETQAQLADWINALRWTVDGKAVVAATAAGDVTVVDPDDGTATRSWTHDAPATHLAVAPDGTIASGGEDGRIVIGGNGAQIGGWPQALSWRPDGGRLAVAVRRVVQLWLPHGALDEVGPDAPATVTSLAWNPSGTDLAAASYGGVRMLHADSARELHALPFAGSVIALAYSPDGRRLAHGNQDASVHFWELEDRTELEMTGYPLKVRELAWRDDGRLLATGGSDEITVWSFAGRGPAGSRPVQLETHEAPIAWIGFRYDGVLASVAPDGRVAFWRPGRSDDPLGVVHVGEPLHCAAWSPDGKRLAVGGAGGLLTVLEVANL